MRLSIFFYEQISKKQTSKDTDKEGEGERQREEGGEMRERREEIDLTGSPVATN